MRDMTKKQESFGFTKPTDALQFMEIWNSLPAYCYAAHPSDPSRVIQVYRLVKGYFETGFPSTELDKMNEAIGVTEPQMKAMVSGSVMGWDNKGCDPKTWDTN